MRVASTRWGYCAVLAAFATSTPELSVGLQASATGRPELALGDALGSNVINIAVVLGVVLLMGPLSASRRELRRDLTLAATAPLLTLVALADGRLVRPEAVVLLVVFGGWLVAVGRQSMRERSAVEEVLGVSAGWRVIVVVLAAKLYTNGRKPTPWATPRSLTRYATMASVVSLAGRRGLRTSAGFVRGCRRVGRRLATLPMGCAGA